MSSIFNDTNLLLPSLIHGTLLGLRLHSATYRKSTWTDVKETDLSNKHDNTKRTGRIIGVSSDRQEARENEPRAPQPLVTRH